MIFKWLEPAILKCEGSLMNSQTFESDYFNAYQDKLYEIGQRVDWDPEKLSTSFGKYQILGENLAYLGLRQSNIEIFLQSSELQRKFARKQFYKMLKTLIRRRGWSWPKYLFSMWNGGIRFVPEYHHKMLRYLK